MNVLKAENTFQQESPFYSQYSHRISIKPLCVYVFTSVQREGFICLGLEFQGTDKRCVEDGFFPLPSPFITTLLLSTEPF